MQSSRPAGCAISSRSASSAVACSSIGSFEMRSTRTLAAPAPTSARQPSGLLASSMTAPSPWRRTSSLASASVAGSTTRTSTEACATISRSPSGWRAAWLRPCAARERRPSSSFWTEVLSAGMSPAARRDERSCGSAMACSAWRSAFVASASFPSSATSFEAMPAPYASRRSFSSSGRERSRCSWVCISLRFAAMPWGTSFE
mmetsp:Transcript_20028/g.59378  ORF Transcript_20028/g.59378 Transcript_20028/m.59378 type:complete len:202 (+) Transcript_20028:141-746(+)